MTWRGGLGTGGLVSGPGMLVGGHGVVWLPGRAADGGGLGDRCSEGREAAAPQTENDSPHSPCRRCLFVSAAVQRRPHVPPRHLLLRAQVRQQPSHSFVLPMLPLLLLAALSLRGAPCACALNQAQPVLLLNTEHVATRLTCLQPCHLPLPACLPALQP